jgi:hypothetical protein
LCCAKILSQEDPKFAEPVLQSMWSNFLKLFPHITLMVQSKILRLHLEK